jgi:hypothetical protein
VELKDMTTNTIVTTRSDEIDDSVYRYTEIKCANCSFGWKRGVLEEDKPWRCSYPLSGKKHLITDDTPLKDVDFTIMVKCKLNNQYDTFSS